MATSLGLTCDPGRTISVGLLLLSSGKLPEPSDARRLSERCLPGIINWCHRLFHGEAFSSALLPLEFTEIPLGLCKMCTHVLRPPKRRHSIRLAHDMLDRWLSPYLEVLAQPLPKVEVTSRPAWPKEFVFLSYNLSTPLGHAARFRL
jgi:hypothetical protein